MAKPETEPEVPPGGDALAELAAMMYDIKRSIKSHRDYYVDDLFSDDAGIRRIASDKIMECLDWLHEPMSPLSKAEHQKRIEDELTARGVPEFTAQALAKQGAKVTGRRPGAPRTTGVRAVTALTLLLTTGKTYREIALIIGGPCEHVCPVCKDTIRQKATPSGIRQRQPRPVCSTCESTKRPVGQREQVCAHCADALRASIGRLEEFLRREGLLPELPRITELECMSPGELAALLIPQVI